MRAGRVSAGGRPRGLVHHLLSPPRGVVNALHLCCFTNAKGPRGGWESEELLKGLSLESRAVAASCEVNVVRLCEGTLVGKPIFFCFFVC